MPKGFDEREKEIIRNKLIEKGREIFSIYGLKKTGVAELTRAAGIAQGTFYSFFDSKEELYFEILQQEHLSHEEFLNGILNSGLTFREAMTTLILEMFNIVDNHPLMHKMLENGEYEVMLRKLPPEKVAAHLEEDSLLAVKFIDRWQQDGYLTGYKPEVLAGLFRSLFFLALHRKEIGEEVYPEVVKIFAGMIAGGFEQDGGMPSPK